MLLNLPLKVKYSFWLSWKKRLNTRDLILRKIEKNLEDVLHVEGLLNPLATSSWIVFYFCFCFIWKSLAMSSTGCSSQVLLLNVYASNEK